MDDEDQDLTNEDLDEEEESQDSDSGSDNSAPPDDEGSDSKGEKGRVDDLMSKWQKAEARAKKAEAALASAKAPADVKQGDKAADGGDAGSNEFLDFQRQSARENLFNQDPRFKEYGLSIDDISGNTLAEMKASAKAQRALIDGIETRARNKVLREHGLDAEVATGAASEKTPSFSEMSQEEFEKFMKQRDSLLR